MAVSSKPLVLSRVRALVPFGVFPPVTPSSPTQPFQPPIPTGSLQFRKAPRHATLPEARVSAHAPDLPPTQFSPAPPGTAGRPPAPRLHPRPRRARPPQAPPLAGPASPPRRHTHTPALSPVKPLGVEDLCFGFAALHWRRALAHGAWARGHLLVTGPRHPPLAPPLPSPAVPAAATAAGPARPPSL